ncbi:retrovirus-related pol polyprotein from transposon TNT 1-94, partial [Tanacetum coccineum]
MDDLSNKSETDSENSLTIFEVRSSDEESTLANNRFTKASEYHVVPPPITGNPLTPRADISFARQSSVKPNVTQAVRSQTDKSGQTSQKQGIGFKKVHKIKACFVCKSTSHLIKDCDFYDQKSPEPRVKNVVNTGKREVKPVWDYGKRVNHQNFSKNWKYPHAKRTFNPSAVLTRAGLVNTDRSNVSTARSISTVRPVYTVRPVSIARPLASKIAQSNSVIRPNQPKIGHLVSKGKVENVLKKAKWVWRPKMNYQDHVYKYNGSYMLKKFEAIQRSCYRIMQWWIVLLSFLIEVKLFLEILDKMACTAWDFNRTCSFWRKESKGKFSVARTPQLNGVTERKNRTLIEAAKTMLAEAVNTACYVLNRVLVTKPQNKIPYELLIGKFDGKSDEGYLLGYSTSSKAFRVYNKRTKRVEENLHINFLEDQPNVAGTGPSIIWYALTHNPTIYDSLVKQFWKTVTVRTLANGTQQLEASIDSKEYTITKALGYARDIVPLLPAMLAGEVVDQGKGSAQPAGPYHTLIDPILSTSQPPIPSRPHLSPPPHSPHQSPPHSPPYSSPHSPLPSPPH